jgi:hypothetical protein
VGNPTCETPGSSCPNNYATVSCDGPEDCPVSQVCCGSRSGGEYELLECDDSCNGQDQYIVCDPAGPDQCTGTDNCEPSISLPEGYEVCK